MNHKNIIFGSHYQAVASKIVLWAFCALLLLPRPINSQNTNRRYELPKFGLDSSRSRSFSVPYIAYNGQSPFQVERVMQIVNFTKPRDDYFAYVTIEVDCADIVYNQNMDVYVAFNLQEPHLPYLLNVAPDREEMTQVYSNFWLFHIDGREWADEDHLTFGFVVNNKESKSTCAGYISMQRGRQMYVQEKEYFNMSTTMDNLHQLFSIHSPSQDTMPISLEIVPHHRVCPQDEQVNDFSSLDSMRAGGWTIDCPLGDQMGIKCFRDKWGEYCEDPSLQDSYCGWAVDGQQVTLRITLHGKGLAILDYGVLFGDAQVLLNGYWQDSIIDGRLGHDLHHFVQFTYTPGDVLEIVTYGDYTILLVHGLHFPDCALIDQTVQMGYLWGSRREQVYGLWNAEMTGQSIFGVEFSTKSDMYTNGDNLYVWLSTGASHFSLYFQNSKSKQTSWAWLIWLLILIFVATFICVFTILYFCFRIYHRRVILPRLNSMASSVETEHKATEDDLRDQTNMVTWGEETKQLKVRCDECVICMEKFIPGDVTRVLHCRHAFHRICIDPWLLSRKSTCPLCHQTVNEAVDFYRSMSRGNTLRDMMSTMSSMSNILSPSSKKKRSDETASVPAPSEKYAGMLERERSRPIFSSLESMRQNQPYIIRGALSPSSIVLNRHKEERHWSYTLSNESISDSVPDLKPELPDVISSSFTESPPLKNSVSNTPETVPPYKRIVSDRGVPAWQRKIIRNDRLALQSIDSKRGPSTPLSPGSTELSNAEVDVKLQPEESEFSDQESNIGLSPFGNQRFRINFTQTNSNFQKVKSPPLPVSLQLNANPSSCFSAVDRLAFYGLGSNFDVFQNLESDSEKKILDP